MGLTRAFQYAGAKTVIASLWAVHDDSTADLMSRFYALLSKEIPPAEALRRAQVDLLKSGGDYAHPFYWAPFVVYGEGF